MEEFRSLLICKGLTYKYKCHKSHQVLLFNIQHFHFKDFIHVQMSDHLNNRINCCSFKSQQISKLRGVSGFFN